jgi:glyoxylase I family protein
MTTIKGIAYVGLSVRDARRSAAWYAELLRLSTVRESFGEGEWDEVLMRHPCGLEIGLLQHAGNSGAAFSEFTTGLDHLEFEVGSAEELDGWRRRLGELGIRYTSGLPHIVTFRDPDNIQLEFFWPGGQYSS